MTPTTPLESRKASSSSPSTVIFFGSLSASGSSADSSTGIQNRRSSSPIPVPDPDSMRNLLSSARSMGDLPMLFLFQFVGRVSRRRNPPISWRLKRRMTLRSSALQPQRNSLDRPLSLYRHTGAGAGVRPVVPHRAVLGAAIVPERDRVFAPAEAALEQRVLGVLVQIGQHRVALVAGDADDEAREAAVDI